MGMKFYDRKGAPEKRETRRGLLNANYLDEIAATAVVGVAAAYGASHMSILPNVREALYNVRHASGTAKDMVLGGPEGMRATKNLEEALAVVEAARGTNEDAGKSLESYFAQRKELVGQLVRAYKENETLGREAERLKLQIEGAVKSVFDIGNEIKPDFMSKVDNLIIKLYGQDPIVAREKSTKVKEFYQQARKFYDGVEKREFLVKEMSETLQSMKTDSESQNLHLNELFPRTIALVREGYETEDIVFAQRRAKDFSESRTEETGSRVKDFRKNVDGTYEEVRREMPIHEYNDTNWVDIVTNPATIGLAAAMIGYAGSKLFLPRIIRSPITKVLAAPVTVPLWGLKQIGKGSINCGRKLIDRLKNSRNTGNSGQPEESKE